MEESEPLIEVIYDAYGFLVDEESRQYFELPERKKFAREHKWRDLLEDWEDKVVHSPEIINARIYKGIPHTMRSRVWKVLVDLDDYVAQQPEGYFESLVSQEGKKEHNEQIWLDIPRTFPDHITLSTPQGREALFQVLKAYSLFNPSIGYCQGMSYIAAVFLMFMSPEEAFWMLRIVLSRDQLEGFYNPCMSKLIENAHLFEKILEYHLPLLSKHLAAHKMDALLFVTPWWMCTFTGIPYWDIVMRIWDCFLWEGGNATYRFALAILQLMEDDLLAMDDAEGLLPILLRPDISKYGHDALFKIAMCIPVKELVAEAETARNESLLAASTGSSSSTPTKSPRKRKIPEPVKREASFLGRIIKSFTPAVSIRGKKSKTEKEVPNTDQKRTPQSSARRRRKSLNKTRRSTNPISPRSTTDSSFKDTSYQMRRVEPSSPLHSLPPSPLNFNSPTCKPLLSSPTTPITPATPCTPHSHSHSHSTSTSTTTYSARPAPLLVTPTSGTRTRSRTTTPKHSNPSLARLADPATPSSLNSPIRRINIRSAALKLDFDSPTRKPLLNDENAPNFQNNMFSPPDATYEQKQFVKEFSTPTPSKGRVRFALGDITPGVKNTGRDELGLTPSKLIYEDTDGENAEEMVEIKRATKRRKRGFTGVPVFEY